MRHDALRDAVADLMREAGARNVQVEPTLIPTRGDYLRARTNRTDQSRLDVASMGIRNAFEWTFFDIRVTHPFAPLNADKDLKRLYEQHEREKKAAYEERVVENEKGSFLHHRRDWRTLWEPPPKDSGDDRTEETRAILGRHHLRQNPPQIHLT